MTTSIFFPLQNDVRINHGGSTIDNRPVGRIESDRIQFHRGEGAIGIANLPRQDWYVEFHGGTPGCDYEEYGQYISEEDRDLEIKMLKELNKGRDLDIFMVLPGSVILEEQLKYLDTEFLDRCKTRRSFAETADFSSLVDAPALTVHITLTGLSIEDDIYSDADDSVSVTADSRMEYFDQLEQVRTACEQLLKDGLDCPVPLPLIQHVGLEVTPSTPLTIYRPIIERCVAAELNRIIKSYSNSLCLSVANFEFYSSGGTLVS